MAQAKEGFDNVPDGYWMRRFKKIGDADVLAALDDPKDQESIKIGFELWENYGKEIKMENILDAIKERDESNLSKRSCRKR